MDRWCSKGPSPGDSAGAGAGPGAGASAGAGGGPGAGATAAASAGAGGREGELGAVCSPGWTGDVAMGPIPGDGAGEGSDVFL